MKTAKGPVRAGPIPLKSPEIQAGQCTGPCQQKDQGDTDPDDAQHQPGDGKSFSAFSSVVDLLQCDGTEDDPQDRYKKRQDKTGDGKSIRSLIHIGRISLRLTLGIPLRLSLRLSLLLRLILCLGLFMLYIVIPNRCSALGAEFCVVIQFG